MHLDESVHTHTQSGHNRSSAVIDLYSFTMVLHLVLSTGEECLQGGVQWSTDSQLSAVADLPDPELDPVIKEAFDIAYDNIYAFHAAQKSSEKSVENMKGVRCKRLARYIGSVGLYVLGGLLYCLQLLLCFQFLLRLLGAKPLFLQHRHMQGGALLCQESRFCPRP